MLILTLFALRQYIIISLIHFYFKNINLPHHFEVHAVLTRKKRVQSMHEKMHHKVGFPAQTVLFVDAVLPRKWNGLTLSYPQVCKQRFKECSAHSTVGIQMVPRICSEYFTSDNQKFGWLNTQSTAVASPQISCNR